MPLRNSKTSPDIFISWYFVFKLQLKQSVHTVGWELEEYQIDLASEEFGNSPIADFAKKNKHFKSVVFLLILL